MQAYESAANIASKEANSTELVFNSLNKAAQYVHEVFNAGGASNAEPHRICTFA